MPGGHSYCACEKGKVSHFTTCDILSSSLPFLPPTFPPTFPFPLLLLPSDLPSSFSVLYPTYCSFVTGLCDRCFKAAPRPTRCRLKHSFPQVLSPPLRRAGSAKVRHRFQGQPTSNSRRMSGERLSPFAPLWGTICRCTAALLLAVCPIPIPSL